jgi:hypothetical protein
LSDLALSLLDSAWLREDAALGPRRPAGHPKGHFSVPREGELRAAYRRVRIAATQNRRSGSIQRHTGNIPTTGAAGRPRRTPPKHHE